MRLNSECVTKGVVYLSSFDTELKTAILHNKAFLLQSPCDLQDFQTCNGCKLLTLYLLEGPLVGNYGIGNSMTQIRRDQFCGRHVWTSGRYFRKLSIEDSLQPL